MIRYGWMFIYIAGWLEACTEVSNGMSGSVIVHGRRCLSHGLQPMCICYITKPQRGEMSPTGNCKWENMCDFERHGLYVSGHRSL